MPETAQFSLYSLNYLLFSSRVEGLSSGDQNKMKQNCPLVKPDFSLRRLFVMLWPHHMCTDPSHWGSVLKRPHLAFGSYFLAAGKAGLSSRADSLGEILSRCFY